MDIGFLLFDGITALDVIGPYEVLARLPGAKARFVSVGGAPVKTDDGLLSLGGTAAVEDTAHLDVLVVPGGYGTRALATKEAHAELRAWVKGIAANARVMASVCTGSFVLGAAGLLEGRRATSHWRWVDDLRNWGATPTRERVVDEGDLITAAGVASGIDMALTLAARLTAPKVAQAIQLGIEYDPQPPFDAGSPAKAPAEVRAMLEKRYAGVEVG
ncbi:MAG: DJ-1/PfpI family protein [Myxococcota bacterium]